MKDFVHFQNPWIDDEYDEVEGSSEDGSNHDSEESSSTDHNAKRRHTCFIG